MNAAVLIDSASAPPGALYRHCVGQPTVASVCAGSWMSSLLGHCSIKETIPPGGNHLGQRSLAHISTTAQEGGGQNSPLTRTDTLTHTPHPVQKALTPPMPLPNPHLP